MTPLLHSAALLTTTDMHLESEALGTDLRIEDAYMLTPA